MVPVLITTSVLLAPTGIVTLTGAGNSFLSDVVRSTRAPPPGPLGAAAFSAIRSVVFAPPLTEGGMNVRPSRNGARTVTTCDSMIPLRVALMVTLVFAETGVVVTRTG